jgi:hypothetical protein
MLAYIAHGYSHVVGRGSDPTIIDSIIALWQDFDVYAKHPWCRLLLLAIQVKGVVVEGGRGVFFAQKKERSDGRWIAE